MKSSCKALKLSIFISLISLALTIVLFILSKKFENDILTFMDNISMGVFSSSIVALMLNIPSYVVAKRQLLEKIWEEARLISCHIRKIDFFYLEFDEKDYINYLNEKYNNNWKLEFNKLQNPDSLHTKEKLSKMMAIDNKYKKTLLEKFEKSNQDLKDKISKNGYNAFIEEQFCRKDEEIIKNLDCIIKQYIEVSKESTGKLNFLLGDMEFISGKKQYKKIHLKIYQPLYELLNSIVEQTYHFNLYINGEGNQCVVLEKLLELQKKIYKEEKNNNINNYNIIIYNTFFDNMLINLEELRAYIYGIKPEKIDIHPTKAIMNNNFRTKTKNNH